MIREAEVSSPAWTYGASAIAADGISGAAEIRVAQLADVYGAGLEGVLAVSF